jgi:hypothetical protein
MSVETEIPKKIINEWVRNCDCCTYCHQDIPCAGVMAGGICDSACVCDDFDYETDHDVGN